MKIKKVSRVINAVWMISAWALLLSPSHFAQKGFDKRPTKADPPTNCETALALLDAALIEAQKDKEGYIILIARLGDGEKSQAINRRRLNGTKDYLVRRTANKVAAAYGERIKGRGRIEIYVTGKMFYVLTYTRNRLIDCSNLG